MIRFCLAVNGAAGTGEVLAVIEDLRFFLVGREGECLGIPYANVIEHIFQEM